MNNFRRFPEFLKPKLYSRILNTSYDHMKSVPFSVYNTILVSAQRADIII